MLGTFSRVCIELRYSLRLQLLCLCYRVFRCFLAGVRKPGLSRRVDIRQKKNLLLILRPVSSGALPSRRARMLGYLDLHDGSRERNQTSQVGTRLRFALDRAASHPSLAHGDSRIPCLSRATEPLSPQMLQGDGPGVPRSFAWQQLLAKTFRCAALFEAVR